MNNTFAHIAAVEEIGNRAARDYFASAECAANQEKRKASLLALDADVERWAAHDAAIDVAIDIDGCVFCNGTGYIARFAHIHGGECYRCNGTGVER